jgi:hypothetical protein
MKVHQISLFVENKPGQLIEPCRILARAGINIRTLSVADSEQFGIMRMIVSDWEKALELLKESGCVVNVTEVLAVEVNDRPGGLAAILEIFENSGINIEYMYSFAFGRRDKAVLIFRFDKPDEAAERLQAAGINIVDSVDVYRGSQGL